MAEEAYPYTAQDSTCEAPDPFAAAVTIQDWVVVPGDTGAGPAPDMNNVTMRKVITNTCIA
jgi:hypothetical protein